jgi:hypothetical protein
MDFRNDTIYCCHNKIQFRISDHITALSLSRYCAKWNPIDLLMGQRQGILNSGKSFLYGEGKGKILFARHLLVNTDLKKI